MGIMSGELEFDVSRGGAWEVRHIAIRVNFVGRASSLNVAQPEPL
jgi:hypothetical protein